VYTLSFDVTWLKRSFHESFLLKILKTRLTLSNQMVNHPSNKGKRECKLDYFTGDPACQELSQRQLPAQQAYIPKNRIIPSALQGAPVWNFFRA
jgi:hypothetical protein